MAERFYGLYVKELMRLAALFPAPTSEILTLGPGSTRARSGRTGSSC
ncbi:hypothetical protein ACN28S_64970 [Cystobacter fuscus]